MKPTPAPQGIIPNQGVDLNMKKNVEEKRKEFNKYQDICDDIEKIFVKNDITVSEMNIIWDFLNKRQQGIINKQKLTKTERTKLQIVDQNTGQPINI